MHGGTRRLMCYYLLLGKSLAHIDVCRLGVTRLLNGTYNCRVVGAKAMQ